MQLLDTDYINPKRAEIDQAVKFIADYPVLCRVRSPQELIVTDLSGSRHEQVCFDLGDYSVVSLMSQNTDGTRFSVLAKHKYEEYLTAITLRYDPFTGKSISDITLWSILKFHKT